MFEVLFSPISINNTVIKNRIFYPSLAMRYSLDGKINDRYLRYYVEKARGGAGIVTVGPVGVDKLSVAESHLSIASDEAIPSFTGLATAIKEAGARAWIQLFHGGASVRFKSVGAQQPLAPSDIISPYTKAPARGMSLEEIHATQEAFIKAAERARQAGFDGVEIIASAGYLICQFLSPARNFRTDEYGGSFNNRTRFAREIIEQMRSRLGNDYPITIRMAGNDFISGSNNEEEIQEIARVYEQAGADAINVTGGWHESRIPQLTMGVAQGGYAYLARDIKKAVSIPVMASNRIAEPQVAEKILRDDMADMVSLGRVLLADPYWPNKAREGHPERIIPCVACMQGCMDELMGGRPVKCTVNARQGFEGERHLVRTDRAKRIMVIGAGPGGLEAAIRAAEAGHEVELYEKAERIGGQLGIASTPPHKQELMRLIDYYEAMLQLHQVKVFLRTLVDAEFVRQKSPDFVILAEGAEVTVPPIPGIADSRVLSAWEVLQNDPPLGRKIAVIGGGAVGLETAHFLAAKGTISPETLYFLFSNGAESAERLKRLIYEGGKQVTVFEMMPKAGMDVGASNRWVLLDNLRKHGVHIITGAKVCSFADGILTFEKEGQVHNLSFDNLINATGAKSVRKLADSLGSCGIPFVVIGDGQTPGKIMDAIHQAYQAVMAHLQ